MPRNAEKKVPGWGRPQAGVHVAAWKMEILKGPNMGINEWTWAYQSGVECEMGEYIVDHYCLHLLSYCDNCFFAVVIAIVIIIIAFIITIDVVIFICQMGHIVMYMI